MFHGLILTYCCARENTYIFVLVSYEYLNLYGFSKYLGTMKKYFKKVRNYAFAMKCSYSV